MISSCRQGQERVRHSNLGDRVVALSVDDEGVVLLDQGPLTVLVGGGLTRDDDMLSVLRGLHARIWILAPGRQVRVLAVQCGSGRGGPVQRRRLLDGVVAQAHGDHLRAVGAADVQRAGLDILLAQHLLLQLDDGVEGVDDGGQHLGRRVLALPAARAGADVLGQVRHVEGGQVLRVGGAVDVLVGRLLEQAQQGPADVGKVRDHAIVHDRVAAEDERVVVDGRHRRARRRADVRKQRRRRRVAADAVEVGVVGRRLAVLVHRHPRALRVVHKVRPHVRVPRHAEAVDVEEPVAQRHFLRARLFARHVREELGEVVVVHLFREPVFLHCQT